ncbi:hypothetical protein A2U01_0082079, partial [Trifolium medium]|nr:hypothetical protein [Trifolium medium]
FWGWWLRWAQHPPAPDAIVEPGSGGFVDCCTGRGLACAGRSAQPYI